MVSRLSKLKPTEAQLVPEAKDFASWKKRNGVSPDTKVSGYEVDVGDL